MEFLERLGLKEWADHYPNEMSGGQKQRVAIARALITKPEIILADEPTGALDSKTSVEIMNLLRELNEKENMTIIVVTHELDSVFTIADRVVMMEKTAKTIVAEGDPVSLRDHSPNPWVRAFLSRDGLKSAGAESTEKREGAQQNE